MRRTVEYKRYRADANEIERRKECALRVAVKLTKKRKEPWMAVSDIAALIGGSDPYLGRTLSLLVSDGNLTMRGEKRFARYKVRAHAMRAAA